MLAAFDTERRLPIAVPGIPAVVHHLPLAAAQPAATGSSADAAWKIIAVSIYAIVLLAIGYVASKRTKTIRDYFASDKKLGFINVAFSARATGESAWLLIGLTGMGFAVGVHAFWVVVGECLGVAGAWLLMARRFKRLTDRYDSLTVPDYLESRFRDTSHWLRLIAAGSLLIFVPIYAGTQVFATGVAFNSFLGWDHFLGAAIGFLVVLFYITQGGFTAVVWSDVFQGSLMFLGLVALPIVGFLEFAGITDLLGALRSIDPHLLSLHGPGPADDAGVRAPGTGSWSPMSIVSVLGFAAIGIGFLGSPQVFVRFISLRSEKEIIPGTLTAVLWTVFADSGAVLVGIVGRALYTRAEIGGGDDDILPYMAVTLLPSFFAGVYIAMVLSAIMSTIDSLLVVASSAAVRDYWQKTRRPDLPDERLVPLSKLLTLALAFVALGIGMGILAYDKEHGVFWAIIFGWSGIAATFCPVMILSLYWSRLTSLGVKCSMVAGFLCVPLFKFAAPHVFHAVGWDDGSAYLGALDVLLPSFAVGFAVAIAVSLFDRGGQAKLNGVAQEIRDAGARSPDRPRS